MALPPREKELLGEGLAVLSKEQLAALKKPLVALRDSLDEANSAFPATKEFLNARGLTNVRQLDAQGREELLQHLQSVLRRIAN